MSGQNTPAGAGGCGGSGTRAEARRAAIAAAIAEADSNIDRVEYLDRDSNMAVMRFGVEVRDRRHLADVMRRVRRLGVVLGIQRF